MDYKEKLMTAFKRGKIKREDERREDFVSELERDYTIKMRKNYKLKTYEVDCYTLILYKFNEMCDIHARITIKEGSLLIADFVKAEHDRLKRQAEERKSGGIAFINSYLEKP